ncbi:hypothetical protein ACGFWI_03305 [Streptomyces sp. NPDC048434]|uniref:hypothetical protein n=1 Tax=Streptomyces sp. NPDC048434 TaxID=3365549 RepID=UPI0037145826
MLRHGSSADPCWTAERDRLLLDATDALHTHHDIDDALWERLIAEFGPEELLDLLMLCGWYHAISFTARATRLVPEPGAPRFDAFPPPLHRHRDQWGLGGGGDADGKGGGSGGRSSASHPLRDSENPHGPQLHLRPAARADFVAYAAAER